MCMIDDWWLVLLLLQMYILSIGVGRNTPASVRKLKVMKIRPESWQYFFLWEILLKIHCTFLVLHWTWCKTKTCFYLWCNLSLRFNLVWFDFTLCPFCLCGFVTTRSTRQLDLKKNSVQWLCNWTLQEVCLLYEDVWIWWVWKKIKKNLPQVLFYVLKSCEKSTKCPYRFVFKSWFVMCSLSTFYFKVLHNFSLLHAPTWLPCICSCYTKPCHSGSSLNVSGELSAVQSDVFEVCWHKTVFFGPWPCYFTESEKKLIQKGHLYIL